MKVSKCMFRRLPLLFFAAIPSFLYGQSSIFKDAILVASTDRTVSITLGSERSNGSVSAIESRMDAQSRELRRKLGKAEVVRIEESIKIVIESDLLFVSNSSDIINEEEVRLAELAGALQKYEDTDVRIQVHTDAMGAGSFNKKISEERAGSLARYLVSRGVDKSRISSEGYGEAQPVAENLTLAGQKKNRRIEIQISANEKMKKLAAKGKL